MKEKINYIIFIIILVPSIFLSQYLDDKYDLPFEDAIKKIHFISEHNGSRHSLSPVFVYLIVLVICYFIIRFIIKQIVKGVKKPSLDNNED